MADFKKYICLPLLLVMLASCNKQILDTSIIDDDTNLTRKEVDDILTKGNKQNDGWGSTNLQTMNTPPNISKLLVAPPPPPMGNGELISFAVTEDVPLKDALIELGRLADVDIDVDPEITGGIILKVTNKPLDVVVKRIAELANLRYTYKNNILSFKKDKPYTKTYNVDFIIDNDVWGTVESSLKDIITFNKEENPDNADYKIIINKPAGIITVYANYKTQDRVSNYIEHVKANYASQVLIEAKVVEVTLNDQYKTGIDWSFTNTGKGGITFNSTQENLSSSGGVMANITTAVFGGSLNAAINALQEFGLTKTLSSPRVHAMNNQKAELKFVNKLIYFSIEKEEEDNNDTGKTKTTYTSTKQEEDVGVMLTIVPSIDVERNEITLNVVPELKEKIEEVVDPTNELNKVPVIQSKTVQTQLKVKSGNVLVIGGLMSEETINADTGIPVLGGIPFIGRLFKSTVKDKQLKENVIFIKASIVRPDGSINNYDRQIYNIIGNKDDYLQE